MLISSERTRRKIEHCCVSQILYYLVRINLKKVHCILETRLLLTNTWAEGLKDRIPEYWIEDSCRRTYLAIYSCCTWVEALKFFLPSNDGSITADSPNVSALSLFSSIFFRSKKEVIAMHAVYGRIIFASFTMKTTYRRMTALGIEPFLCPNPIGERISGRGWLLPFGRVIT